MRIVLFGPPGVGKGSQARFLSEREHVKHISTGELLRGAIRSKSELGRKARSYVEEGELVPGVLVRALAEDAIKDSGYKSFVLDGYPRTIEQAEWLDTYLKDAGHQLDSVLSLIVPSEVIIDRLSKRRVDRTTGENFHLDFKPPPPDIPASRIIQRKDDMPESILHRLQIYHEETHPVQAWYRERGMLQEVAGAGSFEEVYGRILSAIQDSMSRR
ncbi:MAG: adenylate kinase [Bacteroidetes bacterium]|nr:adenylate kinase [Bacteroidota bacterium]